MNKAFLLNGAYYADFKKPQVIGAIKTVLVNPPIKEELKQNIVKNQDAFTSKKKALRQSIENSEGEVQSAYKQEFEDLLKKYPKKRKVYGKPKMLRARIVHQDIDGYYLLEILNMPAKWHEQLQQISIVNKEGDGQTAIESQETE